MRWKKEEIDFLIEKYPTNMPLLEITQTLNKSKKSIQHKAARLEISRPRIPVNKPKNKAHRNISDKRYYEKNKSRIFKLRNQRLKNRKIQILESLGGKCSSCGYNKSIYALEFHHNKGEKEECVSKLIKNCTKQKALKEAEKCIILCSNCHKEFHNRVST